MTIDTVNHPLFLKHGRHQGMEVQILKGSNWGIIDMQILIILRGGFNM